MTLTPEFVALTQQLATLQSLNPTAFKAIAALVAEVVSHEKGGE